MASDRSYKPITGNPNRKTASSDEERSRTDGGGDSDRKRVYVTPRDFEQVDELAKELGIPRSKVYNMAFQALLEKLGRAG